MAPMFGKQLPPELINSMLDYAPIPESAVGKIKQAMGAAQQQAAQAAQAGQQMQMAGAQAKIAETQSKAALNHVKAMREGVATDVESTQADMLHAATGVPGIAPEMGAPQGAPEIGQPQGMPMQQQQPPQPKQPDINQVLIENQRQVAMLANSMAQMGAQIKQALSKPKRVIRDANGAIVGVD